MNIQFTTKFIDLAAQQQLIRSQLDMAIQRVLDHGQYIMGPEVTNFEENLRQFTGAKHRSPVPMALML